MSARSSHEKTAGRLRADRLKYVRKQLLQLTQDEFCQGSDIPKQTYSAWEMVRFSGLTGDGAERVLKRYHDFGILCTKRWLLDGVGAPPSTQSESNDHAIEVLEDVAQELLAFKRHHTILDVYLTDAIMSPMFDPGDTVAGYVIPLSKQINGKYCIVQFDNNGMSSKCIGRVNLYEKKLTVSFVNKQVAPIFIDENHLMAVAPVLWHRKPHIEIMKI